MSMVPLVSYIPGTWLIDECQIAFFMSCLMLRVWTQLFCCYSQCHLSYHQQFVWYPGYHGYQFNAALVGAGLTLAQLSPPACRVHKTCQTSSDQNFTNPDLPHFSVIRATKSILGIRNIIQKIGRYESKKRIKILASKALYKILSSFAYIKAIEELLF